MVINLLLLDPSNPMNLDFQRTLAFSFLAPLLRKKNLNNSKVARKIDSDPVKAIIKSIKMCQEKISRAQSGETIVRKI